MKTSATAPGTATHSIKRSLSGRLGLLVVGTFMAITIVATAIFLPLLERREDHARETIEELLATLVDRDRPDLANELFEGRYDAIALRIAEMAATGDILSIAVHPAEETLPITTGDRAGHHADQALASTADNSDPWVWRRQEDSGPVLHFAQACGIGNEQLGTIHIRYSLDFLQAERRHSILFFFGLIISLLILLGLALNSLLQRMVIRPVKELRDICRSDDSAAGRLSDGDRSTEAEEIAELQSAFRAMLRDRETATNALRKQERDHRLILASLGEAVIAVDTLACISLVNPAAQRLIGRPAEAVLGHPFSKVVHLHSATDADHRIDPFHRSQHTRDDVALTDQEGNSHRVAFTSTPVTDEQGFVTGSVLVLRDITEQVTINEQLRQSQKMQAIGELAGGIAHDFNNQLQIIGGYTDLLQVQLQGQPQHRAVTAIAKAAARSADLTSKLLTFSRRGSFQRTTFDLVELVEEAVDMLRRSVAPLISIDAVIDDRPLCIEGDASSIQNALVNLGVNARDAMPEGGRLTIRCRRQTFDEQRCREIPFDVAPGDYVTLSVTDTGTGIPDQIRNRLFEPFFTTKARGKGTGMGLALVYGTVVDHGGAIEVESADGRGTSIILHLPMRVRVGSSALRAVPATQRSTPDDRSVFENTTILLADDEADVRDLVADYLTSQGFQLITAADGEEAVARFTAARDDIDLVILDMIMPRQDGPATFRAIRRIDSDVPVIGATGFLGEETADDLLAAGMNEIIPKPYQLGQLVTRILAHLPVSKTGNGNDDQDTGASSK